MRLINSVRITRCARSYNLCLFPCKLARLTPSLGHNRVPPHILFALVLATILVAWRSTCAIWTNGVFDQSLVRFSPPDTTYSEFRCVGETVDEKKNPSWEYRSCAFSNICYDGNSKVRETIQMCNNFRPDWSRRA